MSAKKSHPGSVLMEFIMVAPLIMLLFMMVLQYAHIWMARQVTAYAAYCATRATLCVNASEAQRVATDAARLACSWMALVNRQRNAVSDGTVINDDAAHTARFVGEMTSGDEKTVLSGNEEIVLDDGMAQRGEIVIPGWGAISGSDSVFVRVKNVEVHLEPNAGYSLCKVEFKFPLVIPVVGQMISWFANPAHETEELAEYDSESGSWSGETYYSVHAGWHKGRETVMKDDGELEDREDANWLDDHRFPVITLKESCILPLPYSTAGLPQGAFEPLSNRVFGGGM